jgi:hypothetical protein
MSHSERSEESEGDSGMTVRSFSGFFTRLRLIQIDADSYLTAERVP